MRVGEWNASVLNSYTDILVDCFSILKEDILLGAQWVGGWET